MTPDPEVGGPRLDPAQAEEMRRLLADLAADHGVRVLWAIESGSRAWGFPSPDSDYDCRFIYLRPLADYLALAPPRDVIEVPVDAVLDVNGWDLAKALRLLLNGNAVVIEWLMSPLVYAGDPEVRDGLLALARTVMRRDRILRHYLHLGRDQRRRHFGDGATIPLKKVFYALRPAMALRWMDRHPDEPLPPMHFPTLLRGCDPPGDVVEITLDLMARKAVTRELGTGSLPAALASFIDAEFDRAAPAAAARPEPADPAAGRAADAFFRRMLGVEG